MHRVNMKPKSRRPWLPTIPVVRCKPALMCMALCLLASVVMGAHSATCGSPCNEADAVCRCAVPHGAVFQAIDVAVNIPEQSGYRCPTGHERSSYGSARFCGLCGGMYSSFHHPRKTQVRYHCCRPVKPQCIYNVKTIVEPKQEDNGSYPSAYS